MALRPREGSLVQWDPDREPAPLPEREEPRTELRWVRTRRHLHGAVVGPIDVVKVGATVLVYDEKLGRHRRVKVLSVGESFHRGDKLLRYGYPILLRVKK